MEVEDAATAQHIHHVPGDGVPSAPADLVQQAYADGRLSSTELELRLERALTATSAHELRPVVADLPGRDGPAVVHRRAPHPGGRLAGPAPAAGRLRVRQGAARPVPRPHPARAGRHRSLAHLRPRHDHPARRRQCEHRRSTRRLGPRDLQGHGPATSGAACTSTSPASSPTATWPSATPARNAAPPAAASTSA
ncbi:DUF1707 SHOCT-like domain-containing protein [Sphaerisporangium viridialbum]|uniref:DUF1707 SHOCT-like domain-containing protein n=1 Tax=Sphaerisporangium viridialbum TaxID=46189 RepID=UPI003C7712B0